MRERIKVLITVKTYPTPSWKHFETVCTAGVREDGSFIRLYPIDFRYRDVVDQFQKYQWIEVDVAPAENDPRPESFKPYMSTIETIGPVLSTKDYWAERKKIIFQKPIKSMCELNLSHVKDCSLGLIKASSIVDFQAIPVERDWVGKAKAAQMQIPLHGERKDLEKIPYNFRYIYRCTDPNCNGHEQIITDWEVGQLFRKMRDSYGEDNALTKVKERFFDFICGPGKDTHFYVGRVNQHWTWIIIGCFYPKIEPPKPPKQLSLF
ncbi:hypothetical protein [Pseudodesulfovibrio methanolicus]|uniref:Uncharacterized protein n=1 Tax=Pseudodesulfovibrio methanolicus TaxID=3126690 RepID=A0ABZ2ITW4_9BACT